MFLLHVELNVKPGAQNALEDTFAEIFVPAISQQHGFKDVKLLRPAENGGGDYRLSIAFDDQASQRNWVATALLAHRRCVQWGGAHLAGNSLAADVEAYGAADLAGVGYGDDVAVWLAEEEEADFGAAAFAVVEVHAEAVELVVVEIGGG